MEKNGAWLIRGFLKVVLMILCLMLTVGFLGWMLSVQGSGEGRTAEKRADAEILDKFDMYMVNTVSDALDGVLAIDKVYWLSDEDLVAPTAAGSCTGPAKWPAVSMRSPAPPVTTMPTVLSVSW